MGNFFWRFQKIWKIGKPNLAKKIYLSYTFSNILYNFKYLGWATVALEGSEECHWLIVPIEHSQKYHDVPYLVGGSEQVKASVKLKQVFREPRDVEAKADTTNHKGDHHWFDSELKTRSPISVCIIVCSKKSAIHHTNTSGLFKPPFM